MPIIPSWTIEDLEIWRIFLKNRQVYQFVKKSTHFFVFFVYIKDLVTIPRVFYAQHNNFSKKNYHYVFCRPNSLGMRKFRQ